MYEVTSAPRSLITQQQPVARLSTQDAAIRRAERHQHRHPGQAVFVFWHVTERTRLLTFHTLYRVEGD